MKGLVGVLRVLAEAAARRRRTTVVLGVALLALAVEAGVVLAGGSPLHPGKAAQKMPAGPVAIAAAHAAPGSHVFVGHSVKNDTSPALRSLPALPQTPSTEKQEVRNPFVARKASFSPDQALQTQDFANSMPSPLFNFEGIDFPGVTCDCAPPDTNGEVGLSQ
jgi:hypothetical protein